MDGEGTLARLYAVASLRETRAQLRTPLGRLMVGSIAAVFALISLLVGQMLVFEPIGGDYFLEIIWTSSGGPAWWNFPGLIWVQPWGILALPFLPTIAMVLVSYGVGLGMSIAVLLGVRLYRARRSPVGAPTALGSATGLTPAMIALVTLGACCSTTAAATAGIGVAAQTSGTTVQALLLNNWYLNVFQLVILWVALIAQEQLLLAYGVFFEPGDRAVPAVASTDRWAAVRGVGRLALLLGGVTWSLTTLADWTRVAPLSAGAGEWGHWVLQQQVPALLAVAVALAPAGTLGVLRRHAERAEGWVLRGLLLVAGVLLLTWLPPSMVHAGLIGWGNELLGAASPGVITGWGLVFHWAFQMVLLGAFAVAVAVRPVAVAALFAPPHSVLQRPAASPGPAPERGAVSTTPAEP